MIATFHILAGAAVATKVQALPLALFLSLVSHYVLDFFPHAEYSIENIKAKRWKQSYKEFLKAAIDFCLGFLLVFIFSKNFTIAAAGGIIGTLPDFLTFAGRIFPNKLSKLHDKFHHIANHQWNKKIFRFGKIISEVIVVIIAIYIFLN